MKFSIKRRKERRGRLHPLIEQMKREEREHRLRENTGRGNHMIIERELAEKPKN